jgi:hypothetical protein
VDHEQRLDQIGWGQLVLAHQLPDGSGPPTATGSVGGGEGHNVRLETGRAPRNVRPQVAPPPWHVLCLLLIQNWFIGSNV